MAKKEKLFDVFKTVYKKAGEDKRGKTVYDVSFIKVGTADSMEEAKVVCKERHPVLEARTYELYLELTKEQEFDPLQEGWNG